MELTFDLDSIFHKPDSLDEVAVEQTFEMSAVLKLDCDLRACSHFEGVVEFSIDGNRVLDADISTHASCLVVVKVAFEDVSILHDTESMSRDSQFVFLDRFVLPLEENLLSIDEGLAWRQNKRILRFMLTVIANPHAKVSLKLASLVMIFPLLDEFVPAELEIRRLYLHQNRQQIQVVRFLSESKLEDFLGKLFENVRHACPLLICSKDLLHLQHFLEVLFLLPRHSSVDQRVDYIAK